MPATRIAEVTRELARREEYVTMGRFVGQLDDGSMAAAVAVLDDRALLQTAFVMEEKQRLNDIVAWLGEQRIHSLIETAEASGMWSDLTALFGEPLSQPAAAAH
jgi:hypothetical protein